MFWYSVLAGLKVLTYWETYVSGLEYLLIFMAPMFLIGLAMEKGGGKGAAVGCLGMLVVPVLQVAATAFFVLTLAPIIFGFSEDAAWSLPWVVLALAPGAFLKLVGVLVAAAFFVALAPVVGKLQSLQTMVLGGIALIFVLGILKSGNPEFASGKLDVIPGFWFAVGLLLVGGIMSWVGTMVAAVLATAFGAGNEGLGYLLMLPIAAIFGFVPLFMYGAWLGAQVRRAPDQLGTKE